MGMALCLVKHFRPKQSNSIQDKATQAHWKSLILVIKEVLDTKEYTLKINNKHRSIKLEILLECACDSEFVGDRVKESIIIFFASFSVVNWFNRNLNLVRAFPFHPTEAKYFSTSESAKEVTFVYNFLLVGMDGYC